MRRTSSTPRRLDNKTLTRYAIMAAGIFTVFMVGNFFLGNSCRTDRIAVNTKNPLTPQFAYRHDELALLQLTVDDIMMLEQRKDYDRIYDEYTSKAFQQAIPRRNFLMMTNCVEVYLGNLNTFEKRNLGFTRKAKPTGPIDTIIREAERGSGKTHERLDFVFEGMDPRLNAIFWYTTERDFLRCMDDVTAELSKRKRRRKAKAVEPTEATEGTEAATTTEAPTTEAPATEPVTQPQEGQPETAPSEAPATQPEQQNALPPAAGAGADVDATDAPVHAQEDD